jgi:hypothetical protein
MRALHLGLAALALGAILSGCSGGKSGALEPLKTTPAQAEAHIAKLFAEPFKGEATAATDLASVRDALPKEIALTWESLTFDAASGATVLTNVKLAPADMTNIGLGIDEIRLWDFDADFAKARLAGQRLSETARLARRIEAKGLAVFGLETLMAPMTEMSATAGLAVTEPFIDPFLAGDPDLAAEIRASAQVSLDSYEIGAASLIFDDVMLRPFELKPVQLPPDNDFAEAMPFLQGYAAAWRTLAFDTVAAKDATLKYAMTQMGQRIELDMSADTYGVRGMRGGDMDVAVMRGASIGGSMPNPADPSAVVPISMRLDHFAFEGVRFDKLYRYLAIGEWPPRTDTNLMSYGRLQLTDGAIAIGGQTLMTLGESIIDLRDFHWFIPSKARFSANDLVYDFNGFIGFIEDMTAGDSALEGIDPAMLDVLRRYGLDKASFDMAFGWDWNPSSGAATIDGTFGLDGYMRFDAKFSGALPTFKGVSDLIPDGFETADGDAIGQLFASVSNLKLIEANIVDEGGLDKGFALAVELGKMMPIEPGQPDFFANQSPESLRQLAVAGVYALRDQAAREIPQLRALLSPFGAFVEKGGKVKIAFKPARPLGAALIEDIQVGNVAPADLLKDVTVTHTPPAGGPVKPN